MNKGFLATLRKFTNNMPYKSRGTGISDTVVKSVEGHCLIKRGDFARQPWKLWVISTKLQVQPSGLFTFPRKCEQGGKMFHLVTQHSDVEMFNYNCIGPYNLVWNLLKQIYSKFQGLTVKFARNLIRAMNFVIFFKYSVFFSSVQHVVYCTT